MCRGCRKVVKSGWQVVRPWTHYLPTGLDNKVTSSWFFFSTLNYDARSTTHQIYILDITLFKMHVSLCSYYTTRIIISKTLTGTYEGDYTYVFKMCCYRTLDVVIYNVAIYKICI